MADNANVRSLEQLELFRDGLQIFRGRLLSEIENLGFEMRRLTNWLENDVAGYWSDEKVKADRRFCECRDALTRCLSCVRENEKRPCTEEKKRLRKAESRRELCEQKLRMTKAALTHWEAEKNKQRATVERCRDLADSEMLVAIHHLIDQIERLKTYTGLKSSSLTGQATSKQNDMPLKRQTQETPQTVSDRHRETPSE